MCSIVSRLLLVSTLITFAYAAVDFPVFGFIGRIEAPVKAETNDDVPFTVICSNEPYLVPYVA